MFLDPMSVDEGEDMKFFNAFIQNGNYDFLIFPYLIPFFICTNLFVSLGHCPLISLDPPPRDKDYLFALQDGEGLNDLFDFIT